MTDINISRYIQYLMDTTPLPNNDVVPIYNLAGNIICNSINKQHDVDTVYMYSTVDVKSVDNNTDNMLMCDILTEFDRICSTGNLESVIDFFDRSHILEHLDNIDISSIWSAQYDIKIIKFLITKSIKISEYFLFYYALRDLDIIEHIKQYYENFQDIIDVMFGVACNQGKKELIMYLVHYVTPNAKNNEMAMHYACLFNNLEIVRYLIDKGSNSHILSNIICHACQNSSVSIIKCLFENGADICIDGNKPLEAACLFYRSDTIRYLIENGADVTSHDGLALISAVNLCDLDLIKFILINGADINVRGSKALEIACFKKDIEIVKLLLEYGIVFENDDVMLIACESGSYDLFNYFINYGLRIPIHNDELLHHALIGQNENIVRYLIDNDANLNGIFNGLTVLQHACMYKNLSIVQYIIENGVDINRVNSNETALCYAVRSYNLHIVKYLVENGADIHLENNKALLLAYCLQYEDITNYLLELDNIDGLDQMVKTWSLGTHN